MLWKYQSQIGQSQDRTFLRKRISPDYDPGHGRGQGPSESTPWNRTDRNDDRRIDGRSAAIGVEYSAPGGVSLRLCHRDQCGSSSLGDSLQLSTADGTGIRSLAVAYRGRK